MTREEQIFDIASQYAISETDGQNNGKAASKRGLMLCAFRDGAKWADQHPQWIPVEKELPPKFGKYMFLLKSGDMVYEVYYPDLKLVENVTHWMEVQPPRKEASND